MKKIITRLTVCILLLISIMSCEDSEIVPQNAETNKPNAEFEITSIKFRAEEVIEFKDFSADSDGFLTEWNWNFGDGESLISSVPTDPAHIYSKEGEYTITLTVADNTGSLSVPFSKIITLEESTASTTPIINWAYTLSGPCKYSSPAVSDDGTVFIGFNEADRSNAGSNFLAIKDGSKVWGQLLPAGSNSDVVQSAPSIAADGSIYAGSFYNRTIYHMNSGTGDIIGSNNLNLKIVYSAPVFASDGTVYFGGYGSSVSGLYALDASLNTKKWGIGIGKTFASTPAIGSDGTIYAVFVNDYMYAINPDGTEKWKVENNAWSVGGVAIGPDGTIYYSGRAGGAGELTALNPTDGSLKWKKNLSADAGRGGPAIAADGTVYLGSHESKMVAYDPVDGTEKWSFNTSGTIETAPAIDNDGNIYFGDMAGYFHIVDSEGNKVYKSLQLGDEITTSAAIGADGTIYVAANSNGIGKVFALKTDATGLQTGGWPMLARDAKHTGR